MVIFLGRFDGNGLWTHVTIARLNIFVRVQTFRRRPFVPSHYFCHPIGGQWLYTRPNISQPSENLSSQWPSRTYATIVQKANVFILCKNYTYILSPVCAFSLSGLSPAYADPQSTISDLIGWWWRKLNDWIHKNSKKNADNDDDDGDDSDDNGDDCEDLEYWLEPERWRWCWSKSFGSGNVVLIIII